MTSCLSGGAYGFDLENIVKTSSRKTRTPRKRPNQTYNEAVALLSTAFPDIFSITNKNNKQSKLPNQHTCLFSEPSELLLPFPVTRRPVKVKPREVECDGGWNSRRDSSLVESSEGYNDDDFDAESMLDEETEEGIDSIMGNLNWSPGNDLISNGVGIEKTGFSLNFDFNNNTCYGYPIGLGFGGNMEFDFGFGFENGVEELMNPIAGEENLNQENGRRLLLKLNYDKVLEAWDKELRLESQGSDIHTRSAIVDLFSKNGEARKLHVFRRPRSKGRFARSPNFPTCEGFISI